MKKPFIGTLLACSLAVTTTGLLCSAPAPEPKKSGKESPATQRRMTVLAWADARSPMNAPSLLEALQDKDAMVRELAVRGLKDIGWTPAAAPITHLALHDTAFEVREGAVHALRSFKDASHLQTFLKCAADKHLSVRVICLEAAADFPGPTVTQALIAASEDPFPEVRRTSMVLLGRSNDPAAMPRLLAALKDPDAAVRANAAQDIGTFAKMNQPSELKKLLMDPDPRVRASAARSMLLSGDIAGLDEAVKLSRGAEPTARLIAIDALGYSQDAAAKVALAEIVSQEKDITIQQSAQLSLKRIAQRKAQ